MNNQGIAEFGEKKSCFLFFKMCTESAEVRLVNDKNVDGAAEITS